MAREKLGALLMLMFSIAYGAGVYTIPLSFLAENEVFTSRTMPTALAVVGIILSVMIIFLPTVEEDGKKTLGEFTLGMDWTRAVLLIGMIVFYGATIEWIGFVLASIVFLIIGFKILGETSWKKMILAASSLVLVLWAIMDLLLGVYIAPGELFYILGIL